MRTAGPAPPEQDSEAPEPGADSSVMGTVGRHAVIYGLGLLLQRFLSFVMLPVYTRYLTPEDYGVMGLIDMTLDVIAIIAGAQLATGIFRFYHKVDTEPEKNAVVSTAMLGLGISYLIVGMGTFLAAPLLSVLIFGSAVHTLLIRLAAVSLFFTSMTIVPLAYARVQDRSLLYAGASLTRLVLGLTLNIVTLVFLDMGILGVFLSTLISSGVVGIWLSVWVFVRVGVRVNRQATKDLLRYGVPLIATQVAIFINTFADRYFLQAASDEAVVGIYSLAYQFAFLFGALGFGAFDLVWAPKRFEVAKRPDRDSVLSQGFEMLNVVLMTCAVGMSLYVFDAIRVMATPPFYPAATLVPVIVCAYIFQGWSGVQDFGILVKEKTEYLTIANWTAAIVALIGYALLVPRYLAMGAAVATIIAFFTRWALTYAFSQRLFRVEYEWGPSLRLFGITVAVAGTAHALPPLPLLPSLGVRTGLLIVYGVLAWTQAISPTTRTELIQLGTQACRRMAAWRFSLGRT